MALEIAADRFALVRAMYIGLIVSTLLCDDGFSQFDKVVKRILAVIAKMDEGLLKQRFEELLN